MSDVAEPPILDGALRRLRRLFTLAGPIIVSRAGILTMVVADLVMVGRYDAGELAELALGVSLFIPLLVSSIGGLLGVTVLVSRRYGVGDHAGCRAEFGRALPFAALLGVLGGGALLFAPVLLRLTGQAEDLAAGAGAVAQILAPAVFLQLVYVAMSLFLEATQNPRPAMTVMLVANVLNIALNWVFIGGQLGLPAMGAEGAALATSLVRAFFVVALAGYILKTNYLGARDTLLDVVRRPSWGEGGWRAGAPLRALGLASAFSMASETVSYAILNQAAGRLGRDDLAAFAIAYNVEAVVFMVGLGVATATGVLVGAELGRGDRAEARRAALTGAGAVAGVMAAAALMCALFDAEIARLYTDDAAVRAGAAALLGVMAVWITMDGVQLTLAHSLRATGRAWSVARRHATAFLVVMTPLGLWLALGAGFGVYGLAVAASVGCSLSALLMALRLRSALNAPR